MGRREGHDDRRRASLPDISDQAEIITVDEVPYLCRIDRDRVNTWYPIGDDRTLLEPSPRAYVEE
ncbi:MAG TPA: hypothetical protein VE338_20710 [Ktedonobacterales bacterium]|jgi:hypothetical protein|nr:hypothetical protein [Ktedonobacterales bacterium]